MLEILKNGLVEGALYALIALGYTMVYGILGMINFAHGEIYMVGGYAGILAAGVLLSSGAVGASVALSLALVFVFAVLVCAVWGASLERVAYRPLRGAPTLSPLISAIGASFFLFNFVMVAQGNTPKRVPDEIRNWLVDTTFALPAGASISALEFGIFGTSVLMMVSLQLFIHRTRLGKAMRATAQDRTMASLVGIPINRVITATFVIGSGLAAVAGVMGAMYSGVMLFSHGYLPGIKAFTAAVLGGIGNIPGAMLGGFVLGITENLFMSEDSQFLLFGFIGFGVAMYALRRLAPGATRVRWIGAVLTGIAVSVVLVATDLDLASMLGLDRFIGRADYKDVYAFAILLIVLVFRPRGILGEQVSEKV